MARCFKLAVIALCSFLFVAPMLIAQQRWLYEVNQYGLRKAFIEQKSFLLGSNCSTRLQFNATQDGKDTLGVLALEFTVAPISLIKDFDFEYFEGPGAPVGSQKLMRVTVTKGGKSFEHKLSLGGWLSGELDDGFVFAANNLTRNKQGQVRKVLDQVLKGADSLEVAIIDGKNHAIVLSTTFPVTGSKLAFEELLKGF